MRVGGKLADEAADAPLELGPPSSGAGDDAALTVRRPRSVWMLVSKGLLLLTYVLGIALAGWVISALVRQRAEQHEFAFAVAAIFVGLAVPVSLHNVNEHLSHFVSPLQAHVLRVIWMVPIYSIQSWLALVYTHEAIYLEVARECYEAYAIYAFYHLMLGALGGKVRLSKMLKAEAARTGRARSLCLAPLCWLRGWRLGSRFVHRSTVGILQYVIVRIFFSITTAICVVRGGDGACASAAGAPPIPAPAALSL